MFLTPQIKEEIKTLLNLLRKKKAHFPSTFNKLLGEFHFSIDSLQNVIMLRYKVALEPYVKAFQYRILKDVRAQKVPTHRFFQNFYCR